MKTHALIIASVLSICSSVLAAQNPYENVHLVPDFDRSKIRQPQEIQVIRVPHFTLADFKAANVKGIQIGMVNFKAPPNPNEDQEIKAVAKKLGAEIVYVLDDGKHPLVHFILFYGVKKGV